MVIYLISTFIATSDDSNTVKEFSKDTTKISTEHSTVSQDAKMTTHTSNLV